MTRTEAQAGVCQILSGGDRRRVLHLIRMLWGVRRRELQKNGKHLRIADEQTLRDAELLNDEFAHVLHIPQQDVPGLHPQSDGAGGLRRRDPQRINRRNHHGKSLHGKAPAAHRPVFSRQ